jgi:hypothetical protein
LRHQALAKTGTAAFPVRVCQPGCAGRGFAVRTTQDVYQAKHCQEMKKIFPEIRVVQTRDGNLIASVFGQYFAISENTSILIETIKSEPDANERAISEKLTERLGYTVTRDNVVDALNDLPEPFFQKNARNDAFTFSFPIITGNGLKVFSKIFSLFFKPAISLPALAFIFFSLKHTYTYYTMASSGSLITALFILLGILFHEIGHASACYASNVQPGLIGFGFRGIFPTFYTDVSDVWMGDRNQRLMVDAGGIYFQLIYAAFLSLFVPSLPELLAAVQISVLLAIASVLPYFKFDGYWIMSDLFRIDNFDEWLHDKSAEFRKKLFSFSFKISDGPESIGLLAYFLGLFFLCFWMCLQFVNGIKSNAIYISKNVTNGFSVELLVNVLFCIIFALSIVAFAKLALKFLAWLVGKNTTQQINDGVRICAAILALLLIRLLSPLLFLSKKHKQYVNATENAIKISNLNLRQVKLISVKAVYVKYSEAIWLSLLSNIDTKIGLKLIEITHRVKSTRGFDYIRSMNGPVILAAPHFGAFVSGALLILSELSVGRKVHFFYAAPETDPDNAVFEPFYRRYYPNFSVIHNNRKGIVAAAHALRKGEIVVIMPDVFTDLDATKIEFLGQSVSVMPGIAYFHNKFDASVVPILSKFDGFFNINVHIEETVDFSDSVHMGQDRNTQIMSKLFSFFESWINRSPHNWHGWGNFQKQIAQLTR